MPTFPALLFRDASVMVDIDGVDWQRGNESRRGERTGLQARLLSPDIDLRESTFFMVVEMNLIVLSCVYVCVRSRDTVLYPSATFIHSHHGIVVPSILGKYCV